MTDPNIPGDKPDALEQLKQDLHVQEVPPEIIQLTKFKGQLVRHGKTMLKLPNGEKDYPIITIHEEPETPEKDRSVAGATLKGLLDAYTESGLETIAVCGGASYADNPNNKIANFKELYDRKLVSEVLDPLIRKFHNDDNAVIANVAKLKAFAEKEGCLYRHLKSYTRQVVLSGDKRFLIVTSRDEPMSMVIEIADENGELLEDWETKAEFHSKTQSSRALAADEVPNIKPHTLEAEKIARIESFGIQLELDKDDGTLQVYDENDYLIYSKENVIDFVQDNIRPERIYAASYKGNQIAILEFQSKTKPPEEKMIELELEGEICGICLDNQSNTIICTYSNKPDDANMLLEEDVKKRTSYRTGIFSKTTGEKLADFEGGGMGSPVMSENGIIIVPQNDATSETFKPNFQAFRTNLNSFEEGIVEKAELEAEREKLLERLAGEGKDPDEIARELERLVETQEETREDVGETLEEPEEKDPRIEATKERINTMFEQEIEQAKGSVTDLRTIQRKIAILKEGKVDSIYAEFPEIFEDIEERIQKEIETATLEALRKRLVEFAEQAELMEEYEEMKALEEKFSRAMVQRRRLQKEFNGKELEARRTLEELRKRIDEKEGEMRRNIIEQLERQWVAVETSFEEIDSIEELDRAHESPEIQRLEKLFELVDDNDLLREWRGRLSKLKKDKREEIKGKEKELENREKQRERDLVSSIVEDIGFVDDDLDGITEKEAIDQYYKTSALVERIRERVKTLPTETEEQRETKKQLWERVKRIFQDRKREIKTRAQVEDTDRNEAFGFPIFVPEEPRIEPLVKPSARGAKRGTLVFRDNFGKEWTPKVGSMPVDTSDTETREMIELYRDDAKYALFGEEAERVRPLVPEISKEWVVHEEADEYLKDIGRLLGKQVKRQNGILILVGEAGTGKNVLGDIFSHYTNREVFEFACNRQTEKEDVQFAYEYDGKTVKIPSNIIKAIQTPGAVLFFDEINTLPPGVSKLLNSLLDHRRSLTLSDGTKIKAHPTVAIIGAMNPENYIGTNPLPQEVKSRARMMMVGYPEKRVNEAVMYGRLMDSLKGLSPEEFKALWEKIIDGTSSDVADRVDSEEGAKDIRRLSELIKVANLMRTRYRDTQMGGRNISAEDAINFIFSLRDGGQVVEELDDDAELSVKDAIKSVIIPKIGEPEEEVTVTTLVDNA
jgi:MoxR-like ATPase